MLFRRKRQHNVVLYCLFPPCFTIPVFSRSRRLFRRAAAFPCAVQTVTAVFYVMDKKHAFPVTKNVFPAFLFPKKTPSGCKNQPSHARIVGFCQFQNLSIGEMHKVFLRPSGASALNFHAQKSAEKNLFLKSREKALFCIAVSGHAAPQKHVLCLFCRAARHQTEPSGGMMQIQAVTADVTPANMVKCSGNMCQT